MFFADQAFLTDDAPRVTRDGYVVADVRCARSGIQIYSGAELGKPEISTIRVFRPGDEVFSKQSIATYVGKPLTDNHPPEEVTAGNWAKYARGHIGEGALRDGEWLRVPVVMMDGATIEAWRKGKRELSMGYSSDLVWESGTTDSGQEYDAVMRGIVTNHIALVDTARAGSEARIGDATKWLTANDFQSIQTRNMTEQSPSLVSVKVGDRAMQTTEAGAIILGDLIKAHDNRNAQIIDRDKQLAARDARIAELESQILTDAQIEERVERRSILVAAAKLIAKDADFKGLTETAIRRKAIAVVKGEAFIADKSDAYIEAAFDLILDAARKADPIRDGLRVVPDNLHDAGDNGQAKYEVRIRDAWKTQPVKVA